MLYICDSLTPDLNKDDEPIQYDRYSILLGFKHS